MIETVILTAVENEAKYYLENYPLVKKGKLKGMPYSVIDIHGHLTAVIVSGVGTTFTASIATAALFELKPKALFFSGAVGAISPDRRIGDIVIASNTYEVEIQGLYASLEEIEFEAELIHPISGEPQPSVFNADTGLLKLAKAHVKTHPATIGTIASSNQFPSPPSLYDTVKKSGAVAIDMETSALYQVGWLYQVPVIAFRCISNELNEGGEYVEHSEPYIEAEYAAAKYTADFIKTGAAARNTVSLD